MLPAVTWMKKLYLSMEGGKINSLSFSSFSDPFHGSWQNSDQQIAVNESLPLLITPKYVCLQLQRAGFSEKWFRWRQTAWFSPNRIVCFWLWRAMGRCVPKLGQSPHPLETTIWICHTFSITRNCRYAPCHQIPKYHSYQLDTIHTSDLIWVWYWFQVIK